MDEISAYQEQDDLTAVQMLVNLQSPIRPWFQRPYPSRIAS
jgi:hypothetical protein